MNVQQETATGWIEYDYAIVRLVPHVHRSAFLNIGVVVLARSVDVLRCVFAIDHAALAALAPNVDAALLERYADAWCRIAAGGADAGAIGLLPASERFHWLTAPRSSIMQTSPAHPGRCHDLAVTLENLLREHCSG